MNKFFCILLIVFPICSFSQTGQTQSDLALVRKRMQTHLLQPKVQQLNIQKWINAITEDGSWPDINYKDLSRTGFQNEMHLRRLLDLCRAYKTTKSMFKSNLKLKQVIDLALNYWLANDFICDNWWWNQIGTPESLVQVLLIMDDKLSPQQVNKTLAIVARATLNHIPGKFFGARESGDRVKIAGIVAKRLVFERNAGRFGQVIKIIEDELKQTTDRGLQYDFSFHHRKDRVNNTLTYGRQYGNVSAFWAAMVSGTAYQFSKENIHLLVDYFIDGICKMLAYERFPDPGVGNREITRPGALKAYSAAPIERLLKSTNYRREELKKVLQIRNGKVRLPLSYSKFFWQSEYFSIQRPDFFTSVRMYSSRSCNMEKPYNSEGLMNHYRGDGTNYISRSGREYIYLSPVYDWQKIPGATIMQRPKMPPPDDIQHKGLTDFVGAVTDGYYGAVGFNFKSPIDPLKSKKAWFFFDDEYVCLGADISCNLAFPVVTTLNQCRLKGKVVVKCEGERIVLKEGSRRLDSVQWILHDSIGYYFPDYTSLNISNMDQEGSWYRVNHQENSSKREVTEKVFKLWINHGTHPEKAVYQYVIMSAATEKDIAESIKENNIRILSNTSRLQAVENIESGLLEAVFYAPGKIEFAKDLTLIMHNPGIIMIKTNGNSIKEISVEDPTRKLTNIRLSVSSKLEMDEPAYKSTWDKTNKMTDVIVQLPQGVYAGKSVVMKF